MGDLHDEMIMVWNLFFIYLFKGGYLDFSHLTEVKIINITGIYMKNNTIHQELRMIRLHTHTQNGLPLKGYVASLVILRFGARNKEKKSIVGIFSY